MPYPDTPRLFALVPCAGAGARSGAELPKQYVPIAGRAMVAHTLAALARVPGIEQTLVVLAPDDRVFEDRVPDLERMRCRAVRCGGATRAATVAAGLEALRAAGARTDDWILVHDAARCAIQPEWVERLIDACRKDPVGGLLALPLADTLKQERDGRAAATLDRHGKWAAQTPQMFRLGTLRTALATAGDGVTDEASAIEGLGLAPLLVAGELANFKVTWPGDFALAERLLGGTAA